MQQPEPEPRVQARRQLPHQHGEAVAVRLGRDALALLRQSAVQHSSTVPHAALLAGYATDDVAAGQGAKAAASTDQCNHAFVRKRRGGATLSCSGDMDAGVPLKPVCATVSARFTAFATPTTAQSAQCRPRCMPSNELSWQCWRLENSTKVGNAHVVAAVRLAQQHIRRLDIAMDDLRAFGAHKAPQGRLARLTERSMQRRDRREHFRDILTGRRVPLQMWRGWAQSRRKPTLPRAREDAVRRSSLVRVHGIQAGRHVSENVQHVGDLQGRGT